MLLRKSFDLSDKADALIHTQNVPNGVELWAHSHLAPLIEQTDLVEVCAHDGDVTF